VRTPEDEQGAVAPAPAASQIFQGQVQFGFGESGASNHAGEIGSPHPGGSKTSQRKWDIFPEERDMLRSTAKPH
jgi:hypothetical protein